MEYIQMGVPGSQTRTYSTQIRQIMKCTFPLHKYHDYRWVVSNTSKNIISPLLWEVSRKTIGRWTFIRLSFIGSAWKHLTFTSKTMDRTNKHTHLLMYPFSLLSKSTCCQLILIESVTDMINDVIFASQLATLSYVKIGSRLNSKLSVIVSTTFIMVWDL